MMAHKKGGRTWWLTLVMVFGGYSHNVHGSAIPDKNSPDPRIIGGVETEKHEFPSMASLCKREKEDCGCGGTIIFADWVLTAAHCFKPDLGRMRVYAGLHKQSEKDDPDVQVRSITEFKKHPDFDNAFLENDIALIKVSPPFEFNEYVKPAYLPDASCRVNSKFGKLWPVGWGRTETGEKSDVLRKVDVPVIDDDLCKRRAPPGFLETKICAGDPAARKNACPGDSGGPLFQINGESHVVVGITSSGPLPCGANGIPLFTEVPYFIDWIDKNTGH